VLERTTLSCLVELGLFHNDGDLGSGILLGREHQWEMFIITIAAILGWTNLLDKEVEGPAREDKVSKQPLLIKLGLALFDGTDTHVQPATLVAWPCHLVRSVGGGGEVSPACMEVVRAIQEHVRKRRTSSRGTVSSSEDYHHQSQALARNGGGGKSRL